MSWLYSQALVAEYSAVHCSGGELSAPSSGSPTPQAYLPSDRMMDFSRPSRFGMTFAPLTASLGAELLTWFLGASRARTSAPPVKAPESTANDPACGGKWRELSVRYDRATCSWRTHRSLWDEALPESFLTLPRWGSMRAGVLSERVMLARPTSASAYGLWPTPRASANENRQTRPTPSQVAGRHGMSLCAAVNLWPTPTKADGCGGPGHSGRAGGLNLRTAVKSWPTPLATDGTKGGPNQKGGKGDLRLASAVHQFPTPTVNDAKNSTLPPSQLSHDNIPGALLRLGVASGGQLNPTWVEWLMGWPFGWTDLKPLATDKYRNAGQQHGGF